ncbi:MAG: hypothetical protein RLZZ299_1591 [Pseudomonadota bacterium]|jgi:hypothetical protein
MRSLSLILALSLVACGGDDTSDTGSGTDTATETATGTSTGTGTTADPYPLTNDAQVQEALLASQVPSLMYLMTIFTTAFGDGTCPTMTETETTFTATGDCTAADGTEYVGSVTMTTTASGGRITYDNWGWSADGEAVSMHGTHALTMEGGVATSEADDGLTVSITGPMTLSADFSSFDQTMPFFGAEARTYGMQSAFVLQGMGGEGALTVDGEMVYTQACGEQLASADGMDPAEAGPDMASASYTITGSQVVTVTQTECGADCMTWTGATSGSGEICDSDPTSTDTDTFTATGTGTGTGTN